MKTEEEIVRMFENKSLTLHDLCRTCLKSNSQSKVSIYETFGDSISIFTKIMFISKVEADFTDENLPNSICENCLNELEIANNFKMKCENSDALLKKILKDYTNNEFLGHMKKEECESGLIIKREFNGEIFDSLNPTPNQFQSDLNSLQPAIIQDMDDDDIVKQHSSNDCDLSEGIHYSDDVRVTVKKGTSIKTKVACDFCNKLLACKNSLVKHIRSYHSGEKKHSKESLYKIDGYGSDRKFVCTFCQYSSNRKQKIKDHIRTHTGEKPFKCTECPMFFITSSALCNHKKIHSDRKDHICPQCGRQFRMKSKYEEHKLVHTTEKNFQCHICNKFLRSKKSLKNHFNRHDNIRNYSCEACGATFVTSSELVSHSRKHGGEKKFQCDLCSFKSQTRAVLDAHLLRHTGERKFECSFCSNKYYSAGALKNHTVIHTKEKNYPCVFCDQKFPRSSSLNRHLAKAHQKSCKWNDLVDRRIIK